MYSGAGPHRDEFALSRALERVYAGATVRGGAIGPAPVGRRSVWFVAVFEADDHEQGFRIETPHIRGPDYGAALADR